MPNRSLEVLSMSDNDDGEYVCMVDDDRQVHLVTIAGKDHTV